jgi:hypothetical protein
MYLADNFAREEAYVSKLVQKIPVVSHIIRASERHYNIFLNLMRADRFDSLVDGMAINREPTLEEAKAIAAFVNVTSGRGDIKGAEQAIEALNAIFWSPRYLVSRFQAAAAPLTGFRFGGGSFRTRKAIAKEYVKFAIGMATVYYLMQLAFGDDDDFSIEGDPRSSDFGKFRFGNTRIDPLAGFSQVVVLGARLATGETKSTKTGQIRSIRGDDVPFGQDDAFDVGAKFVRSKLSPTLGTIIDLAAGQDVVGRPVGFADVPVKLGMPLVLEDIVKAAEEEGYEKATGFGIAALLGWGVQVHQNESKPARRPARPQRPRRPQPVG